MILSAVWLGVVSGCSKQKVTELRKEYLFSIPIGSGIEEIGVRRGQGGTFEGPESVFFKNGFFYLVDKVNQKIMKITTPGDIILVISAGEEEDPETPEMLRTKERKEYPFDAIGHITVDQTSSIYVENRSLAEPAQEPEGDVVTLHGGESTSGETYQSWIIRFDRLGNFMYRLGRDGRDTEPFDFIYRMQIDESGNLVVVTGVEDWSSWTYHLYDKQGDLVTRSDIDQSAMHENADDGQAVFVMDVVPSVQPGQLVYWSSAYDTTYDSEEIRKEGRWGEEIAIENVDETDEGQARETAISDLLFYKLHYLSVPTNTVKSSHVWEAGRKEPAETTEEFIGIDGESNGFLYKYVDQNSSIVSVYDPEGDLVTRRSFVFEEDGLWTNLNVSNDGTVTAVKIDNRKVHFYRWRIDRLIGGTLEEKTFWEILVEKYEEFRNANR